MPKKKKFKEGVCKKTTNQRVGFAFQSLFSVKQVKIERNASSKKMGVGGR